MMFRFARYKVGIAAFVLICSSALCAWAVDPNPLQSAYWRFEEGAENNRVNPRNKDVVLDSINDNKLQAAMTADFDAAPTYTANVPTKHLKSGLPNTLALDFIPNQDLIASGKPIDNGVIKQGGGFTVEAAFFSYTPNRYGGIVAKEGTPTGNTSTGGTGLPTFAIKTTGPTDGAPQHLRVQQYDGAKHLVNIDSQAVINPLQWYYVAAVNDGSQLSLWLDSGAGYQLQGSVPVNGALYQGPQLTADFNNDNAVNAADYVWWRENDGSAASYAQWRANFGTKNDWLGTWTVGRAQFNGGSADWFDGTIDEVRLSNTALSPSDFLFAPQADGSAIGAIPEPSGVTLVAVALVALTGRRSRNRKPV